jgi:AcrR family transcriptional regulator
LRNVAHGEFAKQAFLWDTRCILSARRHGPLATALGDGAIVAAGVDVFTRLGFASARVEDILESAKIARRTFYKHFASKEAVLAAIYDVATRQLMQEIRGAKGDDPLDLVRHGLDLYLDYHVDNAKLLRLLVEHAIRSDSPLHAARARFREDLVALLDGAVKAAGGPARDPLLYVALISALEGVSLELLSTGARPADVARAKRVMHELLARTLGDPRPDAGA